MPTKDELKAKVQQTIDERKDWIINISKTILDNPEPGFLEVKTSKLVGEKFNELGIPHQKNIAITGVKGKVAGGDPGPTVAVMGELDSLRVLDHAKVDPETGAAHACAPH